MTARCTRSRSGARACPDGVVEFLRLPGIGPKTAARIWTELGVTTLDGLRVAAEEGRLRDLSGLGARSEEKVLKALEAGAGRKAPAENRGLLGLALPAVKAVVEELAAHPSAIAVSEAGSVRRRRETVRDLDFIATSSDPPALIASFCEAEWVAEVVARGETKATVVGHQGLRFDLRVVPPDCYGNVLQHFTGSKDHNVALREEAQRRGLSISEYGVTTVETEEVVTHATEEELYRYLGYALIPPELRENGGELSAAREGRAARARRARRPEGRDALPLDVVLGREELDRGDGRHLEEPGLPVPLHDRPLALPARRATRGAVEGDRGGQRAPEAVPGAARDRGEHPRRRVAGRARRGSRGARLGRRLDPHRLRPEPHGAHPRRPRQPARRLHRPSHRPPDPEADRAPTSTSKRSSSAPLRPAPRSRSTRSPTGSTCATRTRGSPGRRAS